MTTTMNKSPEPKKSNKKVIIAASLVIILALGANHLTLRIGYGDAENCPDSTAIVPPVVDTMKAVSTSTTISVIDTIKKDTTKIK